MPKCTNKGCGKEFTDPSEECHYHPGPPIFHEGQKGWNCCKPRVLTFDEFLTIPPCTTGVHSTAANDLAPVNTSASSAPPPKPTSTGTGAETYNRPGTTSRPSAPAPSSAPKEPEIIRDDLTITPESGAKCRRLACTAEYTGSSRSGEQDENGPCTFHKGVPIFHEGSKGYSCCKRRVLEFDEFLKIPGCTTEPHHAFLAPPPTEGEELIKARTDFYQTYDSVHVSIFAKKVKKEEAKVEILKDEIRVDLPMDGGKRVREVIELYGIVDTEKSSWRVLGTKVEVVLKKGDEMSWSALRRGEETGEIIQVGKPRS
ncbi:chord-domain-containing protein [Ascobolus immersus RN42]|uniref:Chord-domain-containing protein n=1 Tax=Ascobolus immersus RN42 TaxID=1160509 RepID=A0A3N4IBW4_ASCIM|nr:chord-domain-containing protein [Ascobolus immersus RN42]